MNTRHHCHTHPSHPPPHSPFVHSDSNDLWMLSKKQREVAGKIYFFYNTDEMIKREYTFFNSQRVQFDELRQLKGICSLSPVSTFAFLLTPFAFLLTSFTDLLACAAYFLDSFFFVHVITFCAVHFSPLQPPILWCIRQNRCTQKRVG